MTVTLLKGDCLDLLPTLPADSIDSCVTDPPYGLSFMGSNWDHGVPGVLFWREVYRVLKPGAHIVASGGTRTYHRLACAIEDAGFEIRDSLMWLYGVGFPKSQNVAKFIDKELGVAGGVGEKKANVHSRGDHKLHEGWHRPWMDDPEAVDAGGREYLPASHEAQRLDGWGTALKPAFEPIVLARKPLSEKTVAANVLRWGAGALNIGACRVNSGPVEKHVRTSNVTGANSMAGVSTGSTGSGEFVEGRWPANVVHSGEPEVIAAFPNTGASSVRKPSGKDDRGVPGFVMRRADTMERGINDAGGSAARFFQACPPDADRFHYSAKASKADRNGSKHPTVKPIALMQWLARLITPPGGTVLDPFAGSGTTGAACEREGFDCILIERKAEYQADIERRLATPVQSQLVPA